MPVWQDVAFNAEGARKMSVVLTEKKMVRYSRFFFLTFRPSSFYLCVIIIIFNKSHVDMFQAIFDRALQHNSRDEVGDG